MHSAHIGFVGNGACVRVFDFTEFQALDRVIVEHVIDDVGAGDVICVKTAVHSDWSCLIPRVFGDGRAHEVRVRFRAGDRTLNEITWSGVLSDHPYNFHNRRGHAEDHPGLGEGKRTEPEDADRRTPDRR